jgi:transcriptional regulator with XRE-family HTH domain
MSLLISELRFGVKHPDIGTPNPLARIVIPMSAGKRIKGLRKTMGLTQPELAKLAGIQQGSLSELETGETKRPRGDTLVRIAKALQVDPDWLITGTGSPARALQPDPEQQELLSLWSDLADANRHAVIATARALVGSQPKPTKNAPFRRATAKDRK